MGSGETGSAITVDSTRGEGTAFVVTIPFEISSNDPLPASAGQLPAADIHRILLAEDNALNMEIATICLKWMV